MKNAAKGIRTTVFQWFLVVEGAGSFPVDMLRYDCAFPFGQVDATKMEGHHNEHRCLVVVRRGVNQDSGTPERWASYGWRVVSTHHTSYDARETERRRTQEIAARVDP